MHRSRIIVLDIGTHKAQEARLLRDFSFRFSLTILKDLMRVPKTGIFQAFREYREIQALREKIKAFDMAFCFVEPILYPETLTSLKHMGHFVYLRGVTSAGKSGPVELMLAKDSLGNSIIPSKPNLTEVKIPTWNFNFSELMAWCRDSFCLSDEDRLVLRMNAEGVEKEIIEALADLPPDQPKPAVLFGSLGDIKKCFGEDELVKTQALLETLGIRYYYFTSNPLYWREALQNFYDFFAPAKDAEENPGT